MKTIFSPLLLAGKKHSSQQVSNASSFYTTEDCLGKFLRWLRITGHEWVIT